VVDVVLATALAATGLPGSRAIAAVLLYRIFTFKIAVTIAWLISHRIVSRRRSRRPSPAIATAKCPPHGEAVRTR
jgi:uncharacterized membrane protein YbhN (UPF0104 family)